jgi:hypothetical protein
MMTEEIKDCTVWDIDGILEAYKNYPDWVEQVTAKFEALFLFFEQDGLLTCRVSDDQGHVVKRFIMDSEIVEKGQLMCCGSGNPIDRWLASKGSCKNPPDMKILEKALMEIRAGNIPPSYHRYLEFQAKEKALAEKEKIRARNKQTKK